MAIACMSLHVLFILCLSSSCVIWVRETPQLARYCLSLAYRVQGWTPAVGKWGKTPTALGWPAGLDGGTAATKALRYPQIFDLGTMIHTSI